MKLLIVEDESATREGLVDIIRDRLSEVEAVSAENGKAGLYLARDFKPDIVLTDICMPRLDGISMACEIRDLFPDCQIIFLSAYEEIDYYKAAIRLNAVSYLEKPVLEDSLVSTVQKAAEQSRMQTRISLMRKEDDRKSERELALKLLKPGRIPEAANKWRSSFCMTVLVWYPSLPYNEEEFFHRLENALTNLFVNTARELLGNIKSENSMVFHVFSPYSFERETFLPIFFDAVKSQFTDSPYYIAAGNTVHGVDKLFASYQCAAGLLQKGFYEPYQTILICREEDETAIFKEDPYREEAEEVLAFIDELKLEKSIAAETAIYEKLKKNKDMFFGSVRKLYVVFFFSIDRKREGLNLPESLSLRLDEYMHKINTGNLDDIHSLYCKTAEEFAGLLVKTKGEESLILQIKDYIGRNYQDDRLSLKSISDAVHVSVSHMSMIFKKSTSITINQYITDVRMERARYYLKNTNRTIHEISRMTGYKDASYFGRVFRKTVGKTPQEYRDSCKRTQQE